MIKHKFQKGDLVWANLRGYGVVLAIGQKKPRLTQHPPGHSDYAEIRWQDNLHGYQTKIFRGSIGWEKTNVISKAE
tara:strand:+ start:263 stop:490 length:228 start_codon:yes stop_codon:yes gene_type:complete